MTTEKNATMNTPKSIAMKGEVENLLASYNDSLNADDSTIRESGRAALVTAGERVKALNEQLSDEFIQKFIGHADSIHDALKEGYYKTFRVKQDKDTQKASLTERDTIVALPALFKATGKEALIGAWKARVENFTFRMAARANKEVGAIDTKKFATLYKLSDEARKLNGADPLSNRSLREALQSIVDEVCKHPDEKGMNTFKFDERYVKYLLLTVFKAGKGRGCSIAIPNAATIAKFVTICLYSLINGLDFKVECRALDAESKQDEAKPEETKPEEPKSEEAAK